LQDIANGGSNVDRKGKIVINQVPEGRNHGQHKCKEKKASRMPNQGWFKCNMDASFMAEDKCGAWGAVTRDHLGHVVSSAWDYIPHC
jgi:hypothetical protein